MKQYLDMCQYILENGQDREHVVFLVIKHVMI